VLLGYRKIGNVFAHLCQASSIRFVDQPRSFRGKLSQRSFSFSILLFAFSPGGQHHHLSVVATGALLQAARLCVAAECARWASNADATLRTKNSAPSLIDSR
jgi:hypothetical protein